MNDVWTWGLFGGTRGLVQFDGVRRKLDEMLTDAERDNRMELVTMTVDYQTGDLLAESDQDPADGMEKKDRIDAVLASIVEPVMADPVERLGRPNHEILGTFIDGGVRSGTPVMEASRRGAERVLVIKSASLDSDLQPRQKNAAGMLLRTIDLLVDQVGTAEIQVATLHAIARRLGEYNLCDYRLELVGENTAGGDVDERQQSARTDFCQRKTLAPGAAPGAAHAESAVATFVGPEVFGQVAQSWRSVWVVKPEGNESLSGYKVDPTVMRGLFVLGVNTFQDRCSEVLRLLDISEDVQGAPCKRESGAAAVERAKADIEKERSWGQVHIIYLGIGSAAEARVAGCGEPRDGSGGHEPSAVFRDDGRRERFPGFSVSRDEDGRSTGIVYLCDSDPTRRGLRRAKAQGCN